MDENLISKVFDRQLKIEDWNQEALRQQVAFILGVGGIGSIVMINLLREGVKKIFIVDFDVVEIHNLNRQLIYNMHDVGQNKTEAAYKNAQAHYNVGNTEIVTFQFDATKNWSKIVQIASECTAIFNCIDHGDYWDAAVQSLCISLKLPHFIAGSFSQTLMAEIYNQTPCYACLDDNLKLEYLEKITPNIIKDLESIDFLPKNNKPVGQSHCVLCSTAGNLVTQLFLNYVHNIENARQTKKQIFYMTTFESISFPCDKKPNCLLCQHLQ